MLLGILFVLAGSMTAQEDKPCLVAEGLQWARCNYAAQHIYTIAYELRGDTVIDGKTYKKEWQTSREKRWRSKRKAKES